MSALKESTKMSFDEEFERIYKNDCKLPEKISEAYSIFSCLKYSDERQVYIVKDPEGKSFVLKIGVGDNSLRIENEYRIASLIYNSLKNENFPQPVLFFREDDQTYYLREYIDGETLRDKIDKNGVFSDQETCSIAYNICSILEKMHTLPERIICRDIKPENIVISADGKYHIIDLDAARTVKPDNENDTVYLGTRATAAPEQFGFGQTDERTDVYAVGMLMLYMLSGGYDKKELRRGKAARMIERSTRFDPERRYQNISKMKAALSGHDHIPQMVAAASACAALTILAVTLSYVAGIKDQILSEQTANNEIEYNTSADTSITPETVMEYNETTITTEAAASNISTERISEKVSDNARASSLSPADDPVVSPITTQTVSDKMSSFTFLTEDAGNKDMSDMYRAANAGWVFNDDGSYSYKCTQDNEDIVFRLLPEEHFDLKKLRCAAVTVNTTGCEAWFCLTAPGTDGEWFHSNAMGIKDKPEKVIFKTPDGISSGLLLTVGSMTKGSIVTVRDISYSDNEYTGPDFWHENDDGSFTFIKDTVTSLSFFPKSDIELSKVNYVYADIEVEGEMVCGIAGFNSEDGFTYCDGYNLKNESKHLCWDLKHDLSNGKISQSLAFDCYFNSDDLTATVKNIVLSEKPILD